MAKSVEEYKKEIVRQMKAHRIYSKGLDIQITSLASAAHAATKGVEAGVRAAGIPMLADGCVAAGPTLAMVGEYAGASGSPEVIAPLDKLRGMLSNSAPAFGNVQFEIKGRTPVGILKKENNIINRS